MAKPNILLRAKRKKALESFQAKRYDEALALFQGICQADRLNADARMSCGAIAGLLAIMRRRRRIAGRHWPSTPRTTMPTCGWPTP